MRELSRCRRTKGGKNRMKTRRISLSLSLSPVFKICTHCARTMPASRQRVPASFADAVAVSRRPSWAPDSGTTPVAPCWCSPCARSPCSCDSERPDGCDRAAPDRTRRTAWSCDTCTRATCVRPRTRGSSCETTISHVHFGLAKLDVRARARAREIVLLFIVLPLITCS